MHSVVLVQGGVLLNSIKKNKNLRFDVASIIVNKWVYICILSIQSKSKLFPEDSRMYIATHKVTESVKDK